MTTDIVLPGADEAARDPFLFGFGFELVIGSHTIALEPRPLSLEQLKKGTYVFELPEGETRAYGSFNELWDALRAEVKGVPDLPADLPDPIDNLADAPVTFKKFRLAIVEGELEQLLVEVSLGTEWKVPGFTTLEVKSLSFMINYRPKLAKPVAPKPSGV
jgi:hypothetical protein